MGLMSALIFKLRSPGSRQHRTITLSINDEHALAVALARAAGRQRATSALRAVAINGKRHAAPSRSQFYAELAGHDR
jgi:hypothetical protein